VPFVLFVGKMFYPDFRKFRLLARKGNLIPVYKEIPADTETPVSAFLKLSQGKEGRYAYLLESVEGGEKWGRYSFLGNNPDWAIKYEENKLKLIKNNKIKIISNTDPFDFLRKLLAQYQPVAVPELPRFYGGVVGFIGYDMVRFFEKIPGPKPDKLKIPDLFFFFTDTLVIFDNLNHTIKVLSNVFLKDKKNLYFQYQHANKKIERILTQLRKPTPSANLISTGRENLRIVSNFTRKEFEKIVRISKGYIRAGDIIQVQISQCLQTKTKVKPFDIYRALRIINPSPYMYYLKFDNFSLAGTSPEILVRLENKKVEIRPIAGTIRRGKNVQEDLRLEKKLLADPKEQAEHIMLVDLARNDLGRVSKFGSVSVPELLVIERYSHVMHIVSDVVGELRDKLDQFDVLRATFPAGTVTGSPKIRAMEIIEELEKDKRGPYAGAVGYFSFQGNMDMAITIRTILLKDSYAYMQAAAGIVADSKPRKEYQETLNKTKALVKAVELAERGFL